MKKRLTVHFEGHVQGVGFRYNAQQTATGYEVTGLVRNVSDGRVELIAEGEEEEVRAFVIAIGESQLGGMIRRQEEHWTTAQNNFKSFQISS